MTKAEKREKVQKKVYQKAIAFQKRKKCSMKVAAEHVKISVATLQNYKRKFGSLPNEKPEKLNSEQAAELGVTVGAKYDNNFIVVISKDKNVLRDMLLS